MSVPAKLGDPVPLVMILEDGNEAQYPEAEIYEAGAVVPTETVSLIHRAKGRYEGTWTPAMVGTYSAHFFVYSDAGRTVENIMYVRAVEQIFVTQSDVDDLAAAIVRLLGLNHENAFIDNTAFDTFGQLTGARIRLFDSKDHVDLATDGGSETLGLIATYTMSADYEGAGRLKSYRYALVP